MYVPSTDLTLHSADQVLRRINIDNGFSLTFDDVIFGIPVPNLDESKNRNSKLVVSPSTNSLFRKTRTFYYDRIPLTVFGKYKTPQLQVPPGCTLQQLLDVYNDWYVTALELKDVVTTEPPLLRLGESATYILVAHPDSYAYIDEVTLELVVA